MPLPAPTFGNRSPYCAGFAASGSAATVILILSLCLASAAGLRTSATARAWLLESWRERLFAVLSRNAGSVVDFFRIPAQNVIELGTRVQI